MSSSLQFSTLKFCLPQAITSLRIFLSSWALVAAFESDLETAALLVILGVISDGFDGSAARALNVESEFGALFDYFADYLCFIIVPAFISFLALSEGGSVAVFHTIGIPLLAGALRYARMDGLRRVQAFDEIGYPGLSTVLYTCFVVALFFLVREEVLGVGSFRQLLFGSVPILSALMVAPVRYPKLVNSKLIMLPVLMGLGLMPFVATTGLALLTVILIVLYVLFSPFLIGQSQKLVGRKRKKNDSSATLLSTK